MKKILFFIASAIKSLFIKIATTVQKSTLPTTLQEALAMGFVEVTHPKVKGGYSTHIATRNPTLIPAQNLPKGTQEAKDSTLPYFAIDVQGWRSLSTMPRILADTTWTYLGKAI
jgi:hypothetical protein